MPLPDITTVIASVVVIVIIFVAIYFTILKPSSDSAVSTIQSSIDALDMTLSNQNINMKDIKDFIIPTMQATVKKSIDDLSLSMNTKNTEVVKLIDDMKTATANLSTSSNQFGLDIKSIKANLATLQTNLDNLVKSQAIDIKSLKDKDATIDTLLQNQAAEIKLLKEKDQQFDAVIKAFKESEATDTASMKASLEQILNIQFPNILKTIDDLITKETLDTDTLVKRFPELQESIRNLETSTNANVKTLQDQLVANSTSDKQYQGYVNVIKKYIDNAMTIPEISEKVKNSIFKSQKDYFLEFLNLEDDQKLNYYKEQYKEFTGCKAEEEHQFHTFSPMVFKKLFERNDDDAFEYFLLLVFPRYLYMKYNDDGTLQESPLYKYNKEEKTFYFKPSDASSRRELELYELALVKLGMPPLTKNTDSYSYSYANTKAAIIQNFKNYFFDCENWEKLIGFPVRCQDVSFIKNLAADSKCP
jgi:hypothetical protein